MPALFLPNFDFEFELARPSGRAAGVWTATRASAQLAPLFGLAGDPEVDVVFAPDARDSRGTQIGVPAARVVEAIPDPPGEFELVPWGWTPSAGSFAARHGLVADPPDLDSVRDVNSRLFSHALERALGTALEGSGVARSLRELESLVAGLHPESSPPRPWVAKAPFGMAGTRRVLGRGGELDPRAASGALRLLGEQGALVVEPWVDRVEDWSLQGEICADGCPRFVAVTRFETDRAGFYRGTWVAGADDPEFEREALPSWTAAAARLASAGYRGPFGIDAMRYRDLAGVCRVRPVVEINARWTMSRIALRLRALVGPGGAGFWAHLGAGSAFPDLPPYDSGTYRGALPISASTIFLASSSKSEVDGWRQIDVRSRT